MKRQILTTAVVIALLPSLSWGAGFALFEAGAKGLAMGGALTAVADDPSAWFWNPAGMAFQIDEGTQIMAGMIFIIPMQDFTGEAPYPGSGYTASQEDLLFYPPHFYIAKPLNENFNFTFGVGAPFGLGTEWSEDFAGRYIAQKTDLQVIDIGGQLSWKICENFAVGGGIDYMMGTIELNRNIPFINPYTQSVTDVAQVELGTDGLSNNAWAWNAGVLVKLGAGFSLGGMYRSSFSLKSTSASATFTQIPTGYMDFDAMVAGAIPFHEDPTVATTIDFPDYWQIGLAWSNEKFTLSGQYGVMGWSSFKELVIEFPDYPHLSSAVEENYQNSEQIRFGAEWRMSQSWALRAGYVFDETPQPIESMSPLFADGDRDCYSVGLGYISKSSNWGVDVAYEYLELEERSTEGRSYDGFEGTFHDSKAHLFGASLFWKF